MEEKNSKSTQSQVEPKKNRVFFSNIMSRILGISGVVLVILIIGLGALLAGHAWNPSWNPFVKSQSQAIDLSLNKICNEKQSSKFPAPKCEG